MNINLIFDTGGTNASAPAGFKTAMQAAAQLLDGLLTDNITVNINVGYGEYNGTPLTGTVSEGGIQSGPGIHYADLLSALKTHATTKTAQQAIASLGSADPTWKTAPHGGLFLVTNAQEKAWGLMGANGTENDGSVGFGLGGSYDFSTDNSVPANNKLKFLGVAEHELTHALGRLSGLQAAGSGWYSPLDLYRYSAPGALQLQAGQPSYFSIDGGKTNLSQFATSGDDGDWSGATSGTDAFNAISFTGQLNVMSSADITSMSALGFLVACFAADTRIATARGMVPVQALQAGDSAQLAGGGHAPVRWTGHRRVDCARHPRPHDVWPVRVQAHAFAPGQPGCDLYLSPDHAVFMGGVLIPVRYLLNGATIAQIPVESVDYWHVELPAHGVLLAEGLPAESYLDTGNRAAFAGNAATQLHADFARAIWAAEGCAPLCTAGPRVAAVQRRLLARAAKLGHAASRNPALRLRCGGQIIALQHDGARLTARLPDGAASVQIASRAWVPAHIHPDGTDTRSLGVAVSRIWLDGRQASLHSPALGTGWHAPEPGWRWTNGDAAVQVAGARELAFDVLPMGRYWVGRNRFSRAA